MEWLKRVTDDICVGKMSKIAVENRALFVYVVNDVNSRNIKKCY